MDHDMKGIMRLIKHHAVKTLWGVEV